MRWIVGIMGFMVAGLWVIFSLILQALPFVLAAYAILWLLGKV